VVTVKWTILRKPLANNPLELRASGHDAALIAGAGSVMLSMIFDGGIAHRTFDFRGVEEPSTVSEADIQELGSRQ